MNVSSVSTLHAGADRAKAIRAEVSDAINTITKAGDTFVPGTTRLSSPHGAYVEGELKRASWSQEPVDVRAVTRQGDTTVVLRSEILARDTTAVVVGAAAIGGIIGHLLFGRGEKSSLIGELAGAAAGAWGAKKAAEGPGKRMIERVETDPTGVTTERLTVDERGFESYTSTFHRTAPAAPVDPKAVKDYIDKLEI